MIQINCTNCKALLQIDDAFAGGVCRCKHCGTIQTVPSKSRRSNSATAIKQPASKALFQQKVRVDVGSGTGLDDLAEVVASSGLSGTGLQSRRLTKPIPKGPEKSAGSRALIVIGALVIGAALIGLLVWFVLLREH